MAITRTPIFDDDGSGKTGTVLDNAWKQELYGQIDAADAAVVAGVPAITRGTWTPVDGSGAGLTIGVAENQYARFGPFVMVSATLSWPSTANAAQASIVGLPLPGIGATRSSVTIGYNGTPNFLSATLTGSGFSFWGASGVTIKNSDLSAKSVILSAVYITP